MPDKLICENEKFIQRVEKLFGFEKEQETKIPQGINSHWQPSTTAGPGKDSDFSKRVTESS